MYSKTVSDTLARDGWFMWLDSALRIKRSMGICRGKNDKKDSRDIAIYAGVSKTRDGGTWPPMSSPRRSGCCS